MKIHELPAEKIIPYWFRHYFLFAKPIHYITDEEYMDQHQKKGKKKSKQVENDKATKNKIKEIKREQKQAKMLEKARKKYGIKPENTEKETIKEEKKIKVNQVKEFSNSSTDELSEKLSKLSKEQREALLKLLER